jgi:hypothetical protein
MEKRRTMRTRAIAIFISIAAILLACDEEDQEQTRSYYMGFTPVPYESSVDAAAYTYRTLRENADIISHQFDNGVPWVEALAGENFSDEIINDWTFRKNQTTASQKIYISVNPFNSLHNGLASYRTADENLPLPAPWDSYTFNSDEVKTAYLNYCSRIIDFFNPDYFNMAMEANLLYVNKPTIWSSYVEFHQYIYTELKKKYPKLMVFCSISGAHLLKGLISNNDYVQQRLAALQLLEYSDLYSLSFYPCLTSLLGNPYPVNTFDDLFNISEKPLAIDETGYAAQSFSINTGAGRVTIEADADKQEKYIRDLLTACLKRKAVFVINFAVRDYDKLSEEMGSSANAKTNWRDTGIVDEKGIPRKAYTTWKEFLIRKYTP